MSSQKNRPQVRIPLRAYKALVVLAAEYQTLHGRPVDLGDAVEMFIDECAPHLTGKDPPMVFRPLTMEARAAIYELMAELARRRGEMTSLSDLVLEMTKVFTAHLRASDTGEDENRI